MSENSTPVATAPVVTPPAPERYPDRPNPLQDRTTSPWMWLTMALGLVALLALSALAQNHNPLYSDVDTNGISKYKFIEGCREAINETVSKAAAQQPGLSVTLNARDLVAGTTEGYTTPPTSPTAKPTTGPGWTLIAPMQVHRTGAPTQTATLGCHYSKGGKVELMQ